LKRIKLFHAKAYATSLSPSNAVSKMGDDGIGAEERPSAEQLKNVSFVSKSLPEQFFQGSLRIFSLS
jgi:hypothetical protein